MPVGSEKVSDTLDDSADDTADDVVVETTPSASPRSSSGSRFVWAIAALAILFGLVASVMTASYVRLRNDTDGSDSDRTEVSTLAARVAEAMTSLDANGPNQSQADVIRSIATGPFIEQYEQGIESIRKTFGPLKVQSIRGQVVEGKVFVGDVSADQAEVIVVVDLVLVAETPRVVPNQYLRVHLAKIGGAWKVDNVENLNVALAATETTTATTQPTTTQPVAPGTESSSG